MMMVIMIVIRMMIVNAGYDFHLMASWYDGGDDCHPPGRLEANSPNYAPLPLL